MRKFLLLGLLLFSTLSLAAQSLSVPTELPGDPYFVKTSWVIGGATQWGTGVVDVAARKLFIAHNTQVDVVDLASGKLIGAISGFGEAQSMALDDQGRYLYVSEPFAQEVRVVDRNANAIAATIELECEVTQLAWEPVDQMLVAVCGRSRLEQRRIRHVMGASQGLIRSAISPVGGRDAKILLVDPVERRAVASVTLRGEIRAGALDARGRLVMAMSSLVHVSGKPPFQTDRSLAQLVEFDVSALTAHIHERTAGAPPSSFDGVTQALPEQFFHAFNAGENCRDPQALAVDQRHNRAFVSCGGSRLVVFDVDTGQQLSALSVGPGNMNVAYDPESETLFAANANATLSIIRQHGNTDSYAVVQILPTRERALTAVADPSSGQVYMATDVEGVDLANKGGIGMMKIEPVKGSFQVLVIGH